MTIGGGWGRKAVGGAAGFGANSPAQQWQDKEAWVLAERATKM